MQTLFFVLGIIFSFEVPKTETQMVFDWQIASAISDGTEDTDEQRVLARVGWYEANYRRNVASCKIKGDKGKSLGLFQIQPRSDLERMQACGTLKQQVALALVYIRKSRATCNHLEPRDQLSLYTTGRCMNNREARQRWGQP